MPAQKQGQEPKTPLSRQGVPAKRAERRIYIASLPAASQQAAEPRTTTEHPCLQQLLPAEINPWGSLEPSLPTIPTAAIKAPSKLPKKGRQIKLSPAALRGRQLEA